MEWEHEEKEREEAARGEAAACGRNQGSKLRLNFRGKQGKYTLADVFSTGSTARK